MPRHPSRTDAGQIAMVIDGYPGKMQIAGRVVRLGNHEMQPLADGRVFERFMVKLYNTSTPYGDRYQDTFKLASMYLELCNISDSGSYCYEHGVEHSFGTTWDIPTPPKFATVEEADAWMERRRAQRAQQHHVITDDFTRADGNLGTSWGVTSAAFDPTTTPTWACPNDPCDVHGCVGPHADAPVTLPPGGYYARVVDGKTVVAGDIFTVAHGAITYTIS